MFSIVHDHRWHLKIWLILFQQKDKDMKMAKADEDTFCVFVLDFCSTLFILQ